MPPAILREALQARYREPNGELWALIGPDFPIWAESPTANATELGRLGDFT